MEFTLEGLDLFQLTFAEVGLHRPGKLLGDGVNHFCTRALGELGKLFKGVLESPQAVGALDGGPDEECLFGGGVGGYGDGAAYGDLRVGIMLRLGLFYLPIGEGISVH